MPLCYKTIIIFAVLLLFCTMCLCSCTWCKECTLKQIGTDKTSTAQVCQKDDETATQFLNRVKTYRDLGYICE
jgi:hypothetical protein